MEHVKKFKIFEETQNIEFENNNKIEELKKKHDKLRKILIDYGNEEYGDSIIDEIFELFGEQPTTVYYER